MRMECRMHNSPHRITAIDARAQTFPPRFRLILRHAFDLRRYVQNALLLLQFVLWNRCCDVSAPGLRATFIRRVYSHSQLRVSFFGPLDLSALSSAAFSTNRFPISQHFSIHFSFDFSINRIYVTSDFVWFSFARRRHSVTSICFEPHYWFFSIVLSFRCCLCFFFVLSFCRRYASQTIFHWFQCLTVL